MLADVYMLFNCNKVSLDMSGLALDLALCSGDKVPTFGEFCQRNTVVSLTAAHYLTPAAAICQRNGAAFKHVPQISGSLGLLDPAPT